MSEECEYRVGYLPVGASGPVHTKPTAYGFALSEYRAMVRHRSWQDYYKRVWIESRPLPEPWVEVEVGRYRKSSPARR